MKKPSWKAGDGASILFDDGTVMEVGKVRVVRDGRLLVDGDGGSSWFDVDTGRSSDARPGEPAPTVRKSSAADVAELARTRELSALRERIRQAPWYRMDLETLREVDRVISKRR